MSPLTSPPATGVVTRQAILNVGSALNEELVFNRAEGRTISATDQSPVAVAMFPCVVRSFALVQETGGVAASDTDYWTVDLGRWRNGTFAVIASKTTKTVPSGGEAITVLVPWTFDSMTFSGTNAQLLKDDVVGVKYTKTGAASNITRAVLTVRYEGI